MLWKNGKKTSRNVSSAGRRFQNSGWSGLSLAKAFSASPRDRARMIVKASWKKPTVWAMLPAFDIGLPQQNGPVGRAAMEHRPPPGEERWVQARNNAGRVTGLQSPCARLGRYGRRGNSIYADSRRNQADSEAANSSLN